MNKDYKNNYNKKESLIITKYEKIIDKTNKSSI